MPSCRCGEISVVNGKIDLLEREGEKSIFIMQPFRHGLRLCEWIWKT